MELLYTRRTPYHTITTVQPTHYYHLPLGNGITIELTGEQLIRTAEIIAAFARARPDDIEFLKAAVRTAIEERCRALDAPQKGAAHD